MGILLFDLSMLQPQHKIESGVGPITLQLDLVPKMLVPLVSDWVPKAFVVSFKLETDADLLLPKARNALKMYKHKVMFVLFLF